jgi:pimeloyl-ACP methyl ester carboxylesterase
MRLILIVAVFCFVAFTADAADLGNFPRAIDLDSRTIGVLSVMAQKPYNLSIADGEVGTEEFEDRIWQRGVLKKTVVKRDGTRSEEIEGCVYYHDGFGMVITLRGTKYKKDWGTNLDFALENFPGGEGSNVHRGFLQMLNQIEENLVERLVAFFGVEATQSKPIYFVGHSRGGAIATLAAAKRLAVLEEVVRPNQVKVVTFSSPRVGNRVFVRDLHSRIGRDNILTFYCNTDVVSGTPLERWGFFNHGIGISIDWGHVTWGQSLQKWRAYLKILSESEDDDAPFNAADINHYTNRFLENSAEMYGHPRDTAASIIKFFVQSSHSVPGKEAINLAIDDFKYDFSRGLPLGSCGKSEAIFSERNPWVSNIYRSILG